MEVKKDEETSWWGMSEEESSQAGQAWSKVGTNGRYVDITTAFFAEVPQDPKNPRIKAKMDKAHEALEKLTSGYRDLDIQNSQNSFFNPMRHVRALYHL